VPDGEDLSAALLRLDEITRRLRRECPWDREQDERSIVPHTIEEAYELADAAQAGDDAKLLDELGDVLFQVYFLSLLLEERGEGDLAAVAEHCRAKLIRRHPHVFGGRAAETAGDVVRNWTEIKREEERGGDVFGHIPSTHPSTIYAGKVQRRAENAGLDGERHAGEALADARRVCDSIFDPGWTSGQESFERVGELLWDVVAAARALGVDPEVALREHANGVRRAIGGDG
jgi:MazG family protein